MPSSSAARSSTTSARRSPCSCSCASGRSGRRGCGSRPRRSCCVRGGGRGGCCAIDRLALGTVAAIEFLPVIALAALGARTRRNVAALALAVAGVYVLTGVKLAGEPLGFALAFANAGLFALYIVLGHRVAEDTGIDGLAASMLAALVVVTPLAGWNAVPALDDPIAVGAGIGVGVASSVIPYVCDQLAMARLPRSTYALLVSLLPATATVIGIVVLSQIPSAQEVAGVALVIGGVAIHREPTRTGGARERQRRQ